MTGALLTPAQARAESRIVKARARLCLPPNGFFGCIALTLRLAPAPAGMFVDQQETMATDGRTLWYGADYVNKLTENQLLGLVAHEVWHIASKHHIRRGSRDHREWNVACDYATDRDLAAWKFEVPDSMVDPRYARMTAEEIYTARHRDREAGRQPINPRPRPGLVIDAAPSHDKAALAVAESAIDGLTRQSAMIARGAAAGASPASIVTLLGDIGRARVSWRDEVRSFAQEVRLCDYTYSKPNRRFPGSEFIMPGYRATAPRHLVFAVDVSSSMSMSALTQSRSEIQGALDDAIAERVTVIACNTDVTESWSYETGDTISAKMRATGGTRFSPVFEWIDEHAADASGVVYLTDMGSSDFGPEPCRPVLWARYGRAGSPAPWGRVVDVDSAS